MIHFISRYFHELHVHRDHWLNVVERRRAVKLTIILFSIIAFGVLAWVLYR